MALQNSRNRNKGRNKLPLIIAGGGLLLVGALYLIFKPTKIPEVNLNPATQQKPKGKVAIPELARNVSIGATVRAEFVRIKYLDPLKVPVDAIIAPDKFLNRRAIHNLYEGDYIREGDVTQGGAPKGFSGLAQFGKRIVVLSASLFPGSIAALNVGDHVDILAIGSPGGTGVKKGGAPAGPNLNNLGGSQPGAGGRPKTPPATATATGGVSGSNVNPTTATLIAEDAEVVASPKRGRDTEYIVFQMTPQDAHVTTLASSSGAILRYVFRPFGDEGRLTAAKNAGITTRPVRAEVDPDAITVIAGGTTSTARAIIRDSASRSVSGNGGPQVIDVKESDYIN